MKNKRKLKGNLLNITDVDDIAINKYEDGYFFEIGTENATDIAEAVSILMKKVDGGNIIWDMEIESFNLEITYPEKSLFWLSGGEEEWESLLHYQTPWAECYPLFVEKFGFIIRAIVKDAKKLRDIKEKFEEYLNLPILYEFALKEKIAT